MELILIHTFELERMFITAALDDRVLTRRQSENSGEDTVVFKWEARYLEQRVLDLKNKVSGCSNHFAAMELTRNTILSM